MIGPGTQKKKPIEAKKPLRKILIPIIDLLRIIASVRKILENSKYATILSTSTISLGISIQQRNRLIP